MNSQYFTSFDLQITSSRAVKNGYRLLRRSGIAPDELYEGASVFCEWDDGTFYPGKVTAREQGKKSYHKYYRTYYRTDQKCECRVLFDDGDYLELLASDLFVDAKQRHELEKVTLEYRLANDSELTQGSHVYSRWDDGTFYRGRIAKVSGLKSAKEDALKFRVVFDDGDDVSGLKRSKLYVSAKAGREEQEVDEQDGVDDIFDKDEFYDGIDENQEEQPEHEQQPPPVDVETEETTRIKREASLVEHSSRYGDICERLQNIARVQASKVTAENCVHLARALDELLRHPTFPFDLDKAKSVRVKRKKADMTVFWDILACDGKGCGKQLWDEDCWVKSDTKLDTAVCVDCFNTGSVLEIPDHKGLQLEQSRVPCVFITNLNTEKRRRVQHPSATVVKIEGELDTNELQCAPDTGREQMFTATLEGELDTNELQCAPDTGREQMFTATRTTLVPTLQRLRRRLVNGLMAGIIYLRYARRRYPPRRSVIDACFIISFRFKNCGAQDNTGHMCNFVVGDTVDRPVFIVNLQTAEVVRSLDELKDAELYCDDCFFFTIASRA
jgi:hypothetical protein